MKNFLFFLIILTTGAGFAQELDNLFNRFVNQRAAEQAAVEQAQTGGSKCGFGLISEIKRNFESFSDEQQKVLRKMITRADRQTSIVSPSGYFRIHYDTTGSSKPAYSIEDFAFEADKVYDFMINDLGYLPPPSDGTEGGDDKYDIYIRLMSDWGATYPDVDLGNEKHTSYIEMDNDFSDKRTKGFDGAKITLAHEFHHAIQIGNYYYSNDIFFHEITSTSFEEFMYDDVNDYYFEMPLFFNDPNQSLARNGHTASPGYARTIFNLFLEQRFDISIIKRIWELMESSTNGRALPAIEQAIREYGSNFQQELMQFGIWNYYTGDRAVPGKYYEEAIQYPVTIDPMNKYTFYSRPFSKEMINFSMPVSNYYMTYIDSSVADPLEITLIFTNSDIEGALDYYNFQTEQFTSVFSTEYSEGSKRVLDYYTSLANTNTSILNESFVIRGENIDTTSIPMITEEIDYAFPQPFAYSKNNEIFIPSGDSPDGMVELKIFSVSMREVYSGVENLTSRNGRKVVKWNGFDLSNKKLGTGVYIFATKAGDNLKKGKFVIYND